MVRFSQPSILCQLTLASTINDNAVFVPLISLQLCTPFSQGVHRSFTLQARHDFLHHFHNSSFYCHDQGIMDDK